MAAVTTNQCRPTAVDQGDAGQSALVCGPGRARRATSRWPSPVQAVRVRAVRRHQPRHQRLVLPAGCRRASTACARAVHGRRVHFRSSMAMRRSGASKRPGLATDRVHPPSAPERVHAWADAVFPVPGDPAGARVLAANMETALNAVGWRARPGGPDRYCGRRTGGLLIIILRAAAGRRRRWSTSPAREKCGRSALRSSDAAPPMRSRFPHQRHRRRPCRRAPARRGEATIVG